VQDLEDQLAVKEEMIFIVKKALKERVQTLQLSAEFFQDILSLHNINLAGDKTQVNPFSPVNRGGRHSPASSSGGGKTGKSTGKRGNSDKYHPSSASNSSRPSLSLTGDPKEFDSIMAAAKLALEKLVDEFRDTKTKYSILIWEIIDVSVGWGNN